MLNGGIYDHIGGGLCRYSTDAEWLVPHFEKMLYDNAMLIRLANWAYAETGDQLFRDRIETHDRLAAARNARRRRRLCRQPRCRQRRRGGLLLHVGPGRDRSRAWRTTRRPFSSAYTLAAPHGWEGKPIVRSERQRCRICRDQRRCWQSCFDARENTRASRPRRQGAGRLERPGDRRACRGLAAAWAAPTGWTPRRHAYRFVSESKSSDGRLPHSILGDRRLFPAMSSDYAAMANAAIALYEATAEAAYLADAGLSPRSARPLVHRRRECRPLSDGSRQPRRPAPHPWRCRRSDTVGNQPDHRGLRSRCHGNRADRICSTGPGRSPRPPPAASATRPMARPASSMPARFWRGAASWSSSTTRTRPTLSQVAARHPDPRRVDLVLPLGAEPVELPGSVHVDTGRHGGLALPRPIMPAADQRSGRRCAAAAAVRAARSRTAMAQPPQVFIESKKSALVLVCFSLSIRNSIASVVPIGARMRRSTKIFCRSLRGTSRSSLRVPDFRMSMAG